MAEFLAELRRRHIYRIGAGYVVVAWGIAQVIDFLSQVWALPDWVAQPVSLVLAIGFPVVLVAAWMIVGAAKESGTPTDIRKATATDWALVSVLVAVLAFMGYQQFAPRTVEVTDTRVTVAADEIVADIADRLPNSIAVLPFDNVSPNPDDAYFAVGVHDEILNKLSKIRSLTVIARASVMRYVGDNIPPIPEIAQELNVEMVMAGTVRLAGDQVRVTAQLIDGMSNVPVWTTEDEGDLSDIFAIQSDIAMSIANSLQAQFSTEEQESVEAQPTESTEAYRLYLRALTLFRDGGFGGGGGANLRLAARDYLERAIQIDPEFAEAYALLGSAYEYSKVADPVPEGEWPSFRDEMDRLALGYIDRALAIDPSLGLAHAVRGWIHLENGRMTLASEEAEIALELSPRENETLGLNRNLALRRGDFDAAIRFAEQNVASDPNNGQAYGDLGTALHLAGRSLEAVEQLEKGLAIDPLDTGTLRILAAAHVRLGNSDSALDALERMEINGIGIYNYVWLAWGYGILGRPDDAQRMFDQFFVVTEGQYIDPGILVFAHAALGEYDDALRQLRLTVENPNLEQRLTQNFLQHNVWSDPILETPEWVEQRERLRLTE